MDDKTRARTNKIYYEKYLPAFHAFMICYPLIDDDLQGEIWKWISGYEDLYQISNFGRVKSFKGISPRILRPFINKKGYLTIALRGNNNKTKNYYVHVLVAKAFIPNPENKNEVNHLDGVKFNCYVDNLVWSTHSENMKHSYSEGLRNPKNKLTDEQVRYIRNVHKKGDSVYGAKPLSRKFNVSEACIRFIINGKSYKNVK